MGFHCDCFNMNFWNLSKCGHQNVLVFISHRPGSVHITHVICSVLDTCIYLHLLTETVAFPVKMNKGLQFTHNFLNVFFAILCSSLILMLTCCRSKMCCLESGWLTWNWSWTAGVTTTESFQFLTESEIFIFSTMSRTALGPTLPPVQLPPGLCHWSKAVRSWSCWLTSA